MTDPANVKAMRVVAILCWYDEAAELLEETVAALASAAPL
jgi:hypothetical protein